MEADLGVKRQERDGRFQGSLTSRVRVQAVPRPSQKREGRREYRKVKVANYPSHGAHIGMMTS